MPEAAEYSANATLRDGRRISKFPPSGPDDQDDLIAAVGRASGQSLYRRFFAAKREFLRKGNNVLLERRLREPCRLGGDDDQATLKGRHFVPERY